MHSGIHVNISKHAYYKKQGFAPTHLFLISYCFETPKYILNLLIANLITKLKQHANEVSILNSKEKGNIIN